MKSILVTGASGFVGRAVVRSLLAKGHSVRVVVRNSNSFESDNVDIFQIDDIVSDADWDMAFDGIDIVVHCAARVHNVNIPKSGVIDFYREVNVFATLKLARHAASAGVRRFIFLSSIKVNGEISLRGAPFRADDPPAPFDPYAISKLEAERGLVEISSLTGLELVIIRPPLVYGPGVKANFATLIRWISYGLPIPLASVRNARSLVSIGNLVDLIMTCLDHPRANGQLFLVSDGEDVSIGELLRRTAGAMGKRVFLFPFPIAFLEFVASQLGKGPAMQRLCGSLQVDIAKTRQLLQWSPPETLDEGLQKVVASK